MNFVNSQLSLTESEISKIGTIKVEGIINPTNAEMDLKDGVGEDVLFIYFFINRFADIISASISSSAALHSFRQCFGKGWRPRVLGGSKGAAENTWAFGGGIRYRLPSTFRV